MLDYEKEVNVWYALYMTYNDDNRNHADYAFQSAGLQSARSVFNANVEWMGEIFQRIGLTAENIAEMATNIPDARDALKKYLDEAAAISPAERQMLTKWMEHDDILRKTAEARGQKIKPSIREFLTGTRPEQQDKPTARKHDREAR